MSELTNMQQSKVLQSHMFVVRKLTGETKARVVAGGNLQRGHVTKEESSSPTVSTEITSIQRQYIAVNGSHMSLDKWCTGLITRLLEITHGQWLYRNYIVHDPVSGTVATAKKEELLEEIERQRDLGDAGLLEKDKYLAEVNLEEMASSSGERQHYWLLAIQTARNHYALKAQRESEQMAQRDTTGEEGR